jgi:tRNA(fMet)-specific endonuclease VapC
LIKWRPFPPVLLDTDTLSEILKGRDPRIQQKAHDYLTWHGRFSFSLMTRYEILRGLKAKGATRQLVDFERFCRVSEVLPLTDPIIMRAARAVRRPQASGPADQRC